MAVKMSEQTSARTPVFLQAAVMAVLVSGLLEHNRARNAMRFQIIEVRVCATGNQWVGCLWNLAIPYNLPPGQTSVTSVTCTSSLRYFAGRVLNVSPAAAEWVPHLSMALLQFFLPLLEF